METKTMQHTTVVTEYRENGVVVWNDEENGNTHAWVRDGSTGWFIRPEEKRLNPVKFNQLIQSQWQLGKGVYRCTSCGVEMKEIVVDSWPLFAGCVCKACGDKHRIHLQDQISKGHVCRMCGKPYDACSC
jgi:hypothetical protein